MVYGDDSNNKKDKKTTQKQMWLVKNYDLIISQKICESKKEQMLSISHGFKNV